MKYRRIRCFASSNGTSMDRQAYERQGPQFQIHESCCVQDFLESVGSNMTTIKPIAAQSCAIFWDIFYTNFHGIPVDQLAHDYFSKDGFRNFRNGVYEFPNYYIRDESIRFRYRRRLCKAATRRRTL